MVAIGHEVAREEERLAAIAHAHGLRAAGVAADLVEPHARDDLDRLVDELELPGRLERRVVVARVRAPRALVRRHRVLPLGPLEDVRGTRERGHQTVAFHQMEPCCLRADYRFQFLERRLHHGGVILAARNRDRQLVQDCQPARAQPRVIEHHQQDACTEQDFRE